MYTKRKNCDGKQCQMYTNSGDQCRFSATYYVGEMDKCVCGIHKNIANTMVKTWKKIFKSKLYCGKKTHSSLYKKYKEVCNNTRKCKNTFTTKELIKMRDLLEECRDRRISFSDKCYRELSDKGHKEAIKLVQNGITKCNKLIQKKKALES